MCSASGAALTCQLQSPFGKAIALLPPDYEEEGCPGRQVRAAQEAVSSWERKGSYMADSCFILAEVSARRKQVPHRSILQSQSSTYRWPGNAAP